MKILLIGKNGQLGAELEAEISKKHTLFAYGREELDITEKEELQKKIEERSPDVVINTSAFHVVPECEIDPQKAFAINATAIKELAIMCQEKSIQLVTYSTDYVFDGSKGKPYTEEDAPNPLQVYGISKLAGEYAALNYCDNAVVIRTCGVFGGKTGSRSKKGNFVLTMIKQMKGRETLEISSEQTVSPTYSRDLAKATLRLLSKKAEHGIYHLVNEGFCSWAEFASEIGKVTNSSCRTFPVDRRGQFAGVKKPLFSALKNIKAKKNQIVLPTWQDGLRRYIQTL